MAVAWICLFRKEKKKICIGFLFNCLISPMMLPCHFLKSVKEGRTGDVIAALARVGEKGSRIDPTSHSNEALVCAAIYGHVEVVQVLLAWVGVDGKRVNLREYTYSHELNCAAIYGHVEVVRVLLEWVGVDGRRVDPTANKNSAVRWAAMKGHVEVVRVLLEWVGVDGRRVDPTAENNDAMRIASHNGHVKVVQVLLEWVGVDGKRVDPTAEDNYWVKRAAAKGHVEVVRLLLKWVGVDGKRVDMEATRRAMNFPAALAVLDEASGWSPARVAWMIGVL